MSSRVSLRVRSTVSDEADDADGGRPIGERGREAGAERGVRQRDAAALWEEAADGGTRRVLLVDGGGGARLCAQAVF